MQIQSIDYESNKLDGWLRQAFIVIFSSILIALFAPVSIPLPFTPVPLALQPQIVLLLAVFLGSKKGGGAVLSFLGQGAMGLPVFAGGTAGAAILLGPKGGYLMGYLLAAYIVGYLAEKKEEITPKSLIKLMLIGNGLIYIPALPWLAQFTGWNHVLLFGFYPFLPGDIFKTLLLVILTCKFGVRHLLSALR